MPSSWTSKTTAGRLAGSCAASDAVSGPGLLSSGPNGVPPPPQPEVPAMITVDFPGSRKLIDAIDASVGQATTPAITDALRNALCRLIRSEEVKLPECVFEMAGDHYARRELYRSEEHGYSVVAMTWGP